MTDVRSLGTILGVWAHPDDEAYLSAALMALAVQNGQRVVCVTATRGELGGDQCRFVVRTADLAFTPKARDRVTDADGGVWEVESVQLVGFGQLAALDVSIKR